jgi:hypothetical protein
VCIFKQLILSRQWLINSIKVYRDNAVAKRSSSISSAYEDGPLEMEGSIEERSIQPVTFTPENMELEAAYDAFMRGDEGSLLAIQERKAMEEKQMSAKRDGHLHRHMRMHRSIGK